MSGRLRHIGLTVGQTGNRSYAWVLIESASGRVLVCKQGVRSRAGGTPAAVQRVESHDAP